MKHVILTDFGAFSYLEYSASSEERKLYDYITNDSNSSFSQISFNGESAESIQESGGLIRDVADGKVALIERIFSFSFLLLTCYFEPNTAQKLHVSKETFGGGYFTSLYGPNMAPPVVKDLHFHQSNLIEMGFFSKGILHNFKAEIYVKSEMIESPLKGLVCEDEIIERVGNDPRYFPPHQLRSFDLGVLGQVFTLYIIGMVSSFTAVEFK